MKYIIVSPVLFIGLASYLGHGAFSRKLNESNFKDLFL